MSGSPTEQLAPSAQRWLLPAVVAFTYLLGAVALWSQTADVTELPPEGREVELRVQPGQVHQLTISLAEDDFLHVEVDQGTDVRVQVVERPASGQQAGGGSSLRWNADDVPKAWRRESAFVLADRPMTGWLRVEGMGSSGGLVTVRVLRRGPATELERQRYEAERLLHSTQFERGERGSSEITDEWMLRALEAARRFGELGLQGRRAIAVKRAAVIAVQLGRPLEPLEALDQAIAAAASAGAREEECAARLTRAEIIYERSLDEAIAEELSIIDEFEDATFPDCVLAALRILIVDLTEAGEPERAIPLFHRALPLAERIREPWERAALLSNVGIAYLNTGDAPAALEAQRTASQIYADVGDRRSSNVALQNSLRVLRSIGHREGVLQVQAEVVRQFEELAMPGDLQIALESLAVEYWRAGQVSDARKTFERAMALPASSPQTRAATGRRFAEALIEWGDLEAAERHLDVAEALAIEIDQRRQVLAARLARGKLLAAKGDEDGARRLLSEVAEAANASGEYSMEFDARVLLTEFLLARGEGAAATQSHRLIEMVESSRVRLPSMRLRELQAEQVRRAYDLAIQVELRAARNGATAERLFLLAERARARTLQEFLAGARGRILESLDPELREREAKLARELVAIREEQVEATDQASRDEASRRALALESSLEAMSFQWFQRDPSIASLLEARTPTMEEVRAALGEETVLISFQLLGDRVLRFRVDQRQVVVDVIDDASGLRRSVALLNRTLRQPSGLLGGFGVIAHDLHRRLIGSLAVADDTEVVVSTEGWLNALPFEVLLTKPAPAGTRWHALPYWVRDHPIRYTSSASVLVAQSRKVTRKQSVPILLALGDPEMGELGRRPAASIGPATVTTRAATLQPLAHARREAREVAALLSAPEAGRDAGRRGPVRAVFGADATESLVQALSGRGVQFLHLAAHAFVDPRLVGRSAIVLAPDREHDGLLQFEEILRLDLPVDLVVLSACETATSIDSPGEGVSSLAQAFLFAGARSLLASLWRVDDRATADLLIAFYRELVAGRTKAEALRTAKLAAAGEASTAHPYYWSAWQLQGADS